MLEPQGPQHPSCHHQTPFCALRPKVITMLLQPLYTVLAGGRVARTPVYIHVIINVHVYISGVSLTPTKPDTELRSRPGPRTEGQNRLKRSILNIHHPKLLNNNIFTSCYSVCIISGRMITPVLRRSLIHSARQSRCFSSTPIAAAQEVKRLGVIGAGQMVREIDASSLLRS